MSQYNFSTLNDKDLEELTRDLLTRELSVPFQSFKVGKDKGIDLKYSTINSENQIIVQVKHYLNSGYRALQYHLKNKEKEKIDNLNPKRYILVTSVPLSPNDKETIKRELSPHILTTNDIYGADDLNRLITKYSDIEKKHFKLWFSNVNVIQAIINNGISGRSAFIEDKIKRNLGIYVVTKSFDNALDILREQKVLMITGIPGIGKTTLANLITYYLLSKDFRLVYIDEKIRDAEDVFDNDPNVKQLFYFDDFLGSNYVEIVNLKNSENSIINFIERIKSTKNKYLILTTRSTILNQAKSSREKLDRANLDALKYELEVKDYSVYDKGRILYNHLYYSKIEEGKINVIFQNKNYWKIIKHKNYNPRLIEYFTNEEKTNHLKIDNYFDFIMSTLDNPQELWESALNNQLNTAEKFLLFTLLSLGQFVQKNNLELAFDARVENEVIHYGFSREVNIFNNSLKNLLDGYITSEKSILTNNNYIDFINPSLRDYLILFFNRNNKEKWRLVESLMYVEQFMNVFRPKSKNHNNIIIEDNEIRKFIEIADKKKLLSLFTSDVVNITIRKIKLFNSYKNSDNANYIDNLILDCLNDIDWDSATIYFLDDILQIMEQLKIGSDVFKYFQNEWNSIIEKLINASNQEVELKRIKNLFQRFSYDYNSYKKEDAIWIGKLKNTIFRIFKIESKTIIDNGKDAVYSEEDFDKMEEKVSEYFYELSANYYPQNVDIEQEYFPCNEIDIEDLIEDNRRNTDVEESNSDVMSYYEKVQDNTENMVDELFTMFER
ncbi:MAG: hypothetical protein LKI53_04745 [Bacteroidales bacterium]|jgi:adenylate kinase family enzyme|nr:hypothetical protein [Bacteroidales bacterium]